MKPVEIKIYFLGKPEMDRVEVRRWLDDIGAESYELQSEDVISDAEHIIGLAAKRCYNSYVPGVNPNVSKVRSEWKAYFANILQSGHGSVLEHANYTIAFENVSRIFTAELNRHRAGNSISEQSMRYCRFDKDIPFWVPLSIRDGDSENKEKKAKTREIVEDILGKIGVAYQDLVKVWDFDNMKDFHTKKVITSMIRRILPLGIATGAVYTMNGRAIRHICTMRCDPAAEEEICYVFSQVAKEMVSRAPLLFQDFKQTEEGFWYPDNKKV